MGGLGGVTGMHFFERPTPAPDESAAGFIRRFAAANGLPIERLLIAMDERPASAGSFDQCRTIASKLLETDPELAVRIPSFDLNGSLDNRFDRGRYEAVCPACVTEAVTSRQAHRHKLATICDQHDRHLVNECPACDARLSIFNVSGPHCLCGFDLSQIEEGDPPSDEERLLLELLKNPSSHPAFSGTDDAGATCSAFLWALIRHSHGTAGASGLARRHPPTDLAHLAKLVREGMRPLMRWPLGLHVFLEERLAATHAEGVGVAMRLGGWYRSLRQLDRDALRPFWAEVEAFITRFDDVRYAGAGSGRGSTTEDAEWLCAKDASVLLSVRAERIRDAVRSGRLPGRTRAAGLNYLNTSIRRADVERLAAERAGLLTKKAACERFGLSRKVIEALLDEGLVERIPSDHPLYGAMLKVDLLRAAEAAVFEKAPPQGDLAPLSEIAARDAAGVKRTVATIAGLAAGTVEAYWTDHDKRRLGACMIDAGPGSSEAPGFESRLSSNQIAKLMGWKQQVVSAWCRAGLLESQPVERPGRVDYVISLAALLRFQSRYIPLATLSKQRNVSSRALRRDLEECGVATIGGWRDGPSLRGELIEIAKLAALTSDISARRAADLKEEYGSLCSAGC